jgi:hypothetical protein
MRAIAFVLAAACAAEGASAAPVTGKFELDGKAIAPTEVAAFRVRDQFRAREVETYVMLTATAVDKAAIKASLDPYTTAINDPAVMHADYLSFWVKANGEVSMNAHADGTQYVDSSGKIMGMKGSLVATCKENTAARVACTVKTEKPVKSMDGPAWSLDVAFETDIAARPPGKPLAADGEAPGKALLALRGALAGNDFAKILALMTPEVGKSYNEDWRSPEENLQSAKEILDFRIPKEPKITGGEWLADDRALLEVEGVPYPNGRMLYLVEMQKVEGQWRYADSSQVGMLR